MRKNKLVFISFCILLLGLFCSINSNAMTPEEINTYDHRFYPQSVNNEGINKSPQETSHNFSVNPSSGNATVKVTDISLAGKNGLDINITRVYNSFESNLLEPYVKEIEGYSTVYFYKLIGKKDSEKEFMPVLQRPIEFHYNQTVCINPKYSNYTTGTAKYQNMSVFEYADSPSPNINNLFSNYNDALALANSLNDTNPDISATNPSSEVAYYWANYKNFTVVAVAKSVYTPMYTTALLEDTANERYSKLGAGWSFDFPYIEKRYGYEDDYEYLHYGDKGTWEIDTSSNGGTNHLLGYALNDIILTTDTSVTHDGKKSVYVVTEKNGKKSYFADDGRLLIIRDRYYNEIKFYHNTHNYRDTYGTLRSYPYLSKIVDTVNREITFVYESVTLMTVNINDSTNSVNNRQIKYVKENIPRSQLGNNTYYDEYILKRVDKPNGDSSSYSYWILPGKVNFFDRNSTFYNENQDQRNANIGNSYINTNNIGSISGINNYYALLNEAVEESYKNYRFYYSRFLKNCTPTGSMMFFKAYWSSDDVRWDEDENQYETNAKQYYYNINSTGEYDGYPLYKRDTSISGSYRISTKAVNQYLSDNKISEDTYTYRYTGIDDTRTILLDNILSSGTDHKSTASYTYDNTTKLQTDVLIRNYETPSSSTYMELKQNYTYDTNAYGDMITYTPNNNTNYRITYTYHPVYHYLTQKSYKTEANTTLLEKYEPIITDNRSVEFAKIFENDVLKKKTQFSYDSYGNVISEKRYLDNQTDFVLTQYSYADNISARNGKFNGLYLTKKTTVDVEDVDENSHNVEEEYFYNWFGNIVTKIDANKNEFNYERDKLGRVTKEVNPDDSYREYRYRYGGTEVRLTDELGNRFFGNYDTSNNLIEECVGVLDNIIKEYFYNAHNKPIKIIDYSDHNNQTTTLYGYDSLLRPTYKEIKNNDDNVIYKEIYTYNVANTNGLYSKETVTIQGDATTPPIVKSTFKDRFVNIARVENGSDFETYSYNYLGQNTGIKSARANNENWPENFTDQFKYNYLGKVERKTNVLGDYASDEYDTLGRLKKSYDILGNKVSIPYATEYFYDNLGRVVKELTPFKVLNDGSIIYSVRKIYYDDNGNVIKEMQSNNAADEDLSFSEISYEYDSMNRVIKITSNDGESDYYTQNYYDDKGNLKRVYTGLSSPLVINGLDDITTTGDDYYAVSKYEYDEMGRVKKITDPMENVETYVYDKKGTTVSSVDRNENCFDYEYDGLNNLITKSVVVDTVKTDIITTLFGLNTQLVSAENSEGKITYGYNNQGTLNSEINTGDGTTKSYTYDSAGNRKSFILSKNDVVQMTTNYEYDKLNRLWKVYDGTTLQCTYLYDDNGNRTTMEVIGGDTTIYDYNLANLLTSQVSGSKLNEQYTYYLNGNQKDKTSNGVTTTYKYDKMNRLVAEDDTIYTFDDFGNRFSKTNDNTTVGYTYDLNNRLNNSTEVIGDVTNITDYYYDNNGNQIAKSTISIYPFEEGMTGDYQGSDISANSIAIYEYNAYNNLIGVDTNGVVSSYTYDAIGLRNKKNVGNDTLGFIYDGVNIIAEVDSVGTIANKYLRGVEIIKNQSNNTLYLYDGQGDIVNLINSNGDVIADYKYDAFGNEDSENTVYNPFGYRGEYVDAETGFIYLRARYYSADIGCFISEDPIRHGLNWYVYANNNPIRFLDPLGLVPTVAESAYISEHVYTHEWNEDIKSRRIIDENGVYTGWRMIDMMVSGSLKIGVYVRGDGLDKDSPYTGPLEYVLAFKGTNPSSSEDWENNAQQYLGTYSEHLVEGIMYSAWFVKEKSGYEITFVGHSKGGGEAALNAMLFNKKAIVFNPSVPDFTWHFVKSRQKQVFSYVVKGDILNHHLKELPGKNTKYLPAPYKEKNTLAMILNHEMSSIINALAATKYGHLTH